MADDDSLTRYDICLSFAGEQREYVAAVAESLRTRGVRVFYDDYERATLWGKDLYEHLAWIYSKAAKYCILFASEDYARKVWTNHERRNAQERALTASSEYVLPVTFDETEIPGLRKTIGYIDGRTARPEAVADLALSKLGAFRRQNFIPPNPDRLFKALKMKSETEHNRSIKVAQSFLRSLMRTNEMERQLISYVYSTSCPHGGYDEPHVNLDVMRRDKAISASELLEGLHALESLGFRTSVEKHDGDSHSTGSDAIHLKWNDMTAYKNSKMLAFAAKHSTAIAAAMVDVALAHYCEGCSAKVIDHLDFSKLASED